MRGSTHPSLGMRCSKCFCIMPSMVMMSPLCNLTRAISKLCGRNNSKGEEKMHKAQRVSLLLIWRFNTVLMLVWLWHLHKDVQALQNIATRLQNQGEVKCDLSRLDLLPTLTWSVVAASEIVRSSSRSHWSHCLRSILERESLMKIADAKQSKGTESSPLQSHRPADWVSLQQKVFENLSVQYSSAASKT